jgi:hypothetical protein
MGGSSLKAATHPKKNQVSVPLNPKAIDNKTRPLKIYIVINLNNVGNE